MTTETQTQDLGANPALRRFRTPGDIVNRATAELPDEARTEIRWLHAYAWEHDIPLPELARLVRYDESTLSRVFNGKYEGNIDNVVAEVRGFRKLQEERNKGRKLSFIETSLTRRIWRVCAATLEFQRISFIYGDSQIGKTTALVHYRDTHNHGSTIYVRMPTGGAMTYFLSELAEALRISTKLKERDLWRRIIHSFDDRMLLIVDECHQALLTSRRINPIEFIRELHDTTGCGVVLAGTNVFRDELNAGHLAPLMKQTTRRRLLAVQLPNVPPDKDLNTFAEAYGLPPATGEHLKLQTDFVKQDGLGMWLCLFRNAAKLAANRKTRLTWKHVGEAHAAAAAIAIGQD